MIDNARVDVAAIINEAEISRFQYLIFSICILIIMCDGFDRVRMEVGPRQLRSGLRRSSARSDGRSICIRISWG